MIKEQFKFLPNLILRSPVLPFSTDLSHEAIIKQLDDPLFAEALYLASPELFYKSKQLKENKLPVRDQQKLVNTLANYLNRMRSRCTPFGLFAGCTVTKWGSENKVVLKQEKKRHTRLDMHYLCALAQHLSRAPFLKKQLLYFTNSSYYQIGDEIRYIEYNYVEGRRAHQISSVGASPLLLKVMEETRKGLHIHDIVSLLVEEQIKEQEAHEFIEELINVQLLVSELEPAITGNEFLEQLLNKLETIHASHPEAELSDTIQQLHKIDQALKQMDRQFINSPQAYDHIASSVIEPGEVPDKSKLFQTDLIYGSLQGSVNERLQQSLLQGMDVIRRLRGKKINEKLEAFKARFTHRYEGNEMPLLEILDAETGIGYAENGRTGNQSLIEDIKFPDEERTNRQGERSAGEQMLQKKIRHAELTGNSVIMLDDHELASLPENKSDLPPSLSISFRLPTESLIHLEGAFGSSAINLLGRFAHADNTIYNVIRQIADHEANHNPDVLFAEIVHLPETRTGNILLRPIIRAYEIPFLAQSSLPDDQQIHLQDLYVTVRHNKVRLYSKKLKKEIVPRLGTAHNYVQQSLPLYHFLCDLQIQDMDTNLNVNWSPAAYESIHLPRLMYKNIVLGLATWQLDNKDYEALTLADAASLPDAFKAFQKRWKLPTRFTLADGDRELLVDANEPATMMSWLETIRKRNSIVLKEFLFEPEKPVATNSEGLPLVNHFLAPLLNTKNVYPKTHSPRELNTTYIPYNFSLGSEWLYYKIYCGEQSIDKILIEVIDPLVEHLKQNNCIDYWFFIRYYDPDCHLRVRFHLPDTKKIGDVISIIYNYISPLKSSGHIWKLQTCTYQRELARYGSTSMVLSEKFFYCDSSNVLSMISANNELVNEDNRWIWGIYSIDKLLSLFNYPLNSRLSLMQTLKEAFANEFKVDKIFKLQIDQKYRLYREKIEEVLSQGSNPGEKHLFATDDTHILMSTIASEIKALHASNQLDVTLDSLLSSYIHMHVNRLMQSGHRMHELLKYDFLYRHYRSQSAILQQSAALTSSLP